MKKVLSVLLVVMMLLACVGAVAEEVPSKTTDDLTVVVETVSESGEVLVEVVEADEQVLGYMANVVLAAVAPDFNVLDLFTEETKALIAEKTGDAALEMNEVTAIDVLQNAEETGRVQVKISFVTPYTVEQTLVAVATVFTGDVMEEIVLEAAANEDGTVTVIFTAEAMAKMVNADAIALAILNTK